MRRQLGESALPTVAGKTASWYKGVANGGLSVMKNFRGWGPAGAGWLCAALLGSLVSWASAQPLEPEQIGVETLGPPSPHWLIANDANFLGYMDSKVYLFDGDSGEMLAMISAGGWRNAVELAPDLSHIYSPETYYSRLTRGERTDVVTLYDTSNAAAVGEVVIPPKRASGMPHRHYSGISDDGRLVYVMNLTPAMSVSVVDVQARSFAGEIDTPGCAMVYPTGPRSLALLCGDGTVQELDLNPDGTLAERARSPAFFDPDTDPVTEKAVRAGNRWLYFSFEGWVHPVDFGSGAPAPASRWSLFDDRQRSAGWRVGGLQFVAAHADDGTLYVLVHQGGPGTHKSAGTQVWIFDLTTRKRRTVIELAADATSIAVTQDDAPLLIASNPEVPALLVYDARSGRLLRTIQGPPFTPIILQTLPASARSP